MGRKWRILRSLFRPASAKSGRMKRVAPPILHTPDPIERLYAALQHCQTLPPDQSRSAKLLSEGLPKMAKKLAEEAVEAGHEAILGNRVEFVRESADVIYNLVTLWVAQGIPPEEIWREMQQREEMLGVAEKRPKQKG